MTANNIKGPILIAGATRGIGREIALRLLKQGIEVVLVARDEKKLREIGLLFPESAHVIPWDLSQIETIDEFAGRVNQLAGAIGGLVCCIGAQKTLPFSLCKPQVVQDLFAINTLAPIELLRTFIKKGRISTDGGTCIFLSSLAAHEGAVGKSIYGAAKGALEGLIPPIAAELAPKKIRINGVILGIVRTDMANQFLDRMSSEQISAVEKTYPFGIGEPQDVGGILEFLLSSDGAWITGQTFTVDGGHSVRP